MKVNVNKLRNGEFCTTGMGFDFDSDETCRKEFVAMKKRQQPSGEFQLELINNELESIDSFRISHELANEISDGKLI